VQVAGVCGGLDGTLEDVPRADGMRVIHHHRIER
jgi:hypothetical protein